MAKIRELFGAESVPEIKERLGLLQNAAESKLALFKNDLRQQIQDPMTFAGDHIVSQWSGIVAQVSTDLNESLKSIADLVFLGNSEETKKAVLGAVTGTIQALLTSGTGGQVKEDHAQLAIVEDEVPLIFHMYVWRYTFTSVNVIGSVDNGMAYYVVKAGMKPEKFTKENLASSMSSHIPMANKLIDDAVLAAEPLKRLPSHQFEQLLESIASR